MIARTYDEIDLLFVDIGFFLIEADLPAALIIPAATFDGRKVTVGSLVVERLSGIGDGFRAYGGERPSHAGFPVAGGDASVAVRANSRIDVRIGGARSRARWTPSVGP